MGWVPQLLTEPRFHFTYPGFHWIAPLREGAMYGVFFVMALSAICISLGLLVRSAALLFFLTFTYVELIDKTTYLNHYYFVSLVAFLLIFIPCDKAFALGKARCGQAGAASSEGPEVPRLHYLVFRTQVGMVYFFAGFAKLNADWLLRAEPLGTWLRARAETVSWFSEPSVAYVMSWAGAAFDLSVPFLLATRRSRPYAYAAVVCFHVATWLLFPIGVFPWLMIAAATVFFEPNWPEMWRQKLASSFNLRSRFVTERGPSTQAPVSGWSVAFFSVFLAVQAVLPLRYLAHGGSVNWHEQGFRFAWRVMLVEKSGLVEYEVVTKDGRRFREYPRRELTALQYRMLSTQPDMIVDYARELGARYERRGEGKVRVFAYSRAALNRRASQTLVRPDVDLMSDLEGKAWIEAFVEPSPR